MIKDFTSKLMIKQFTFKTTYHDAGHVLNGSLELFFSLIDYWGHWSTKVQRQQGSRSWNLFITWLWQLTGYVEKLQISEVMMFSDYLDFIPDRRIKLKVWDMVGLWQELQDAKLGYLEMFKRFPIFGLSVNCCYNHPWIKYLISFQLLNSSLCFFRNFPLPYLWLCSESRFFYNGK